LLFEEGKPVVIEFNLAAFDELPCACIMRTFLDRVVDVSNGDVVLDLVVKDSLKRTDDLYMPSLASFCIGGVCVEKIRTTTPPISNRMAVGGLDDQDMAFNFKCVFYDVTKFHGGL
jgi:hypothetical protein